jgi:hypothetical protein
MRAPSSPQQRARLFNARRRFSNVERGTPKLALKYGERRRDEWLGPADG